MTNATKLPPVAVATLVLEGFPGEFAPLPDGVQRVDRQAKLIRGVKICGLESRNTGRIAGFPAALGEDALDQTYGYMPEALREAVPLYEGAACYRDHPESSVDANGRRVTVTRERKFNELAGKFRNVRFVDGHGLFGDLNYLESDPQTPKLLEAAESMPDAVAMSHRAFCRPERVNGRVMMTKIVSVASVDLVTGTPGTTENLFESAPMTPPAAKPTQENTGLLPGGAPAAAPTMEQDQPAAPAADPKTAITDGIAAAIDAVVRGEGTVKEKLPKIEALLTQQDATNEALGGGKPAMAPAGDAPASESAELVRLRNRDTAVQLLESAKVGVSNGRVTMLANAAPADRAALLTEFQKMDGGANVLETAPLPARSGGTGNPNPPGTPQAWSAEGLLARTK